MWYRKLRSNLQYNLVVIYNAPEEDIGNGIVCCIEMAHMCIEYSRKM
jgi:hypothetical protein